MTTRLPFLLVAILTTALATREVLERRWCSEGPPRASDGWLRASCDEAAARDAYEQLWNGSDARPAFRKALARSPASADRWCDLGEAFLTAGDTRSAADCFDAADRRAPASPPVLWRVANAYLRIGAMEAALRYAARVLALVRDFDDIVFSTYRRFFPDVHTVLEYGVPHEQSAARAYFRNLLGFASFNDGETVWQWMMAHGFVDDALACEYDDQLLREGHVVEADVTWRRYLGPRRRTQDPGEALFNGDFENLPTGCRFDWTLAETNGARVARDRDVRFSGTASLRVDFDGTQNLAFFHVTQLAFVAAGRYRLTAWVRTRDVTTDEGVRLRVFDAESPSRLDVLTDPQLGTHEWRQIDRTFSIVMPTRLVAVQVVRNPSRRFDNKIHGTFWLDRVSLAVVAGR